MGSHGRPVYDRGRPDVPLYALPQRYQAMTKAEADQAVESLREWLNHCQVAALLGRPCSTVQTALSRCRVVMRRRHDYD